MADQGPKSLPEQPERVENDGPSSLRRSLPLFKKRQIEGEIPSATHQNSHPSIRSIILLLKAGKQGLCSRVDLRKFYPNIDPAKDRSNTSELIVPSADIAICRGHVKFEHLVVSINEAWSNSVSLDAASITTDPPLQSQQPIKPPYMRISKAPQFQLPRPQPDYAVGFSYQAFTQKQLSNLTPFIGDISQTSFFLGTADMFFPFLTSEVKGKAALDIADRQNAHSMTLAVRGVVELFRIVKREKELNGEILGFSISYDYCSVRIYGHYPVINEQKITYHRHSIHKFDFTALDGREKWTSYKFTMSVYSDWAPSHFQRLCSAIDAIPHVDFEVSQQTEEPSEILQQPEVSELSFSETTRPSQEVEGIGLGSSFTTLGVDDSASRNAASDCILIRA
ncbi:predicted protein [Histoplasma mississippiense (nom. inval.)]|uniref:predicted protein n=1 Tax=Ajellomyces capsulatus (strain NAm1 / WU24) TaxID=2059318 RepID=UPI000157CC64|nr:predicted protein [Histoplasma mississippiense (nom. inval.)]EDN10308.1 predicted protein [Histoplasma mississippiense (nom. inval.)]